MGLGNKSDNEGTGVSKREPGVRNGLNEFFGAKSWSKRGDLRNKSWVAAQQVNQARPPGFKAGAESRPGLARICPKTASRCVEATFSGSQG